MSYVDVIVIVLMAIPIAAVVLAVLAVRRWKGTWRLAAAIPVALIAVWTLGVVLSWPYEHTLWPLELLLYGSACLVYVLILRAVYKRLSRAREANASRSAPASAKPGRGKAG